ncbi:GNAT family N-acetyltransferase [Amycolatopsis sp. NPDC052450]|uniref:GNAT family N-acetyltransferase n=1 Tax=Amycolatopsis sp. NPDC052450 TaxID=3363937 RepID=UPI0037CC4CE4
MAAEETDTGSGPVTLRRSVPAGAERRAAELCWGAFGRKLGPALNPPDKAVPFLAARLDTDRAVCAFAGGELVAFAEYQLGGQKPAKGAVIAVLRTYGWIRGLYRLALLALFENRPKRGRLVVAGIAVDPGSRGHGIGSLLVEELAAIAAERGCREIRLDVIDTNPRAKALYERLGFATVRTTRTPYLRRLLGFGAVTTMCRGVAPKGLPAQ